MTATTQSPIRLSREELTALDPCDQAHRLALFGRRKYLTARLALEAGATVSDLLWVAGRLGRKDLCVKFALACAQRTAHLNPDPRVQAALDATAAWLANPCEDTQSAASSASSARSAALAAASSASSAALAAASSAAWAAEAAARWPASSAALAAEAAARWLVSSARSARSEQEVQKEIFLSIFDA